MNVRTPAAMLRFERKESNLCRIRCSSVRYIRGGDHDVKGFCALSDEYRVAFAGERFGSIYMVEAEQVVLVRYVVEYVIWLLG